MNSYDVNQNATAQYTGVIKDEAGTALAAASLTSLTLTLYDVVSNTIINSRSAQSVLNLNGVTVDSSGNLTWVMVGGATGDNQILNTSRSNEKHRAVFGYTWSSGTKYASHEVEINVKKVPNYGTIPSPGP